MKARILAGVLFAGLCLFGGVAYWHHHKTVPTCDTLDVSTPNQYTKLLYNYAYRLGGGRTTRDPVEVVRGRYASFGPHYPYNAYERGGAWGEFQLVGRSGLSEPIRLGYLFSVQYEKEDVVYCFVPAAPVPPIVLYVKWVFVNDDSHLTNAVYVSEGLNNLIVWNHEAYILPRCRSIPIRVGMSGRVEVDAVETFWFVPDGC